VVPPATSRAIGVRIGARPPTSVEPGCLGGVGAAGRFVAIRLPGGHQPALLRHGDRKPPHLRSTEADGNESAGSPGSTPLEVLATVRSSGGWQFDPGGGPADRSGPADPTGIGPARAPRGSRPEPLSRVGRRARSRRAPAASPTSGSSPCSWPARTPTGSQPSSRSHCPAAGRPTRSRARSSSRRALW
jgi:hypothetical protein